VGPDDTYDAPKQTPAEAGNIRAHSNQHSGSTPCHTSVKGGKGPGEGGVHGDWQLASCKASHVPSCLAVPLSLLMRAVTLLAPVVLHVHATAAAAAAVTTAAAVKTAAAAVATC
jgi:hypothetical protein